MVDVRGLSRSFGENRVLSGIDLQIAEGEILAIMGASGGGKTTLLRCISGLLPPSEGTVMVDGVSSVDFPEDARGRMGLVFQSAALFDFMNVRENLEFGIKRRLRTLSKDERATRVVETLALVGLEDTGHLMPSELSGGMRKRIGLARALAIQPKVMLYDEPTTGLDPITTYTIDELILDVRGRLGMTSLLVSHDVASVCRTADRVAFLEGGELTFVGSPQEFQDSDRPAIRELLEKSRATSFPKRR
jgi:phospholipid/cholesterol/gamma-HCH transport system ATP-binding protein